MVSERRYSSAESNNNEDKELLMCNLIAGKRIIGFSYDPNVERCDEPMLLNKTIEVKKTLMFIDIWVTYISLLHQS